MDHDDIKGIALLIAGFALLIWGAQYWSAWGW